MNSGTVDLVLTGSRVVTPHGVRPAAIAVDGGRIRSVEPPGRAPRAARRLDAGDAVVMPGLVDAHVHVNEPGRTEWEGFVSAGAAAAAGGITLLADMPLNATPVTTTPAAFAAKARSASERCAVDYAFWGGVVPGNDGELEPLLAAGVPGFKCFLVPSGIDEFPAVGEPDLRRALPILARRGVPLLAHAELPGPIDAAARRLPGGDPRSYARYLASRPDEAELEAIELLIRLCREFRAPVHVVHLAAPRAMDRLRAARREGLPLTVETCPHYLTFAAEEIPDGATVFKCAPPIRRAEDREGLWQGLRDGTIDLVASDHSPCPPAMKRLEDGDFAAAWGGIASLELLLPAVWTAARARAHDLTDLARWLCEGPARLLGLSGSKGRIAAGYDADLVIWRPEEAFTVRAAALHHRHPQTPYDGRHLVGVVRQTFLRGVLVFDRDQGLPAAASGRLVRRAW
jgi:allantoinase